MIYRFIREHTGEFRVGRMCGVLKVSRAGYYHWLTRPVGQRRMQDEVIKEQILNIYHKSRSIYGSPRIHRQLNKQGIHCGKKRVERPEPSCGLGLGRLGWMWVFRQQIYATGTAFFMLLQYPYDSLLGRPYLLYVLVPPDKLILSSGQIFGKVHSSGTGHVSVDIGTGLVYND